MRVRLFGKTNDDKGTQLETLTKRLLEQRGYKNVVTNFVGSGGSEVDIHCEFPLPTLSGLKSVTLIGECKAYEHPISIPDWLKFLGKVFTERTCRRRETRGVLLALSGANGNVLGAYEELRLREDIVELISGSTLADLLAAEFTLGSVEALHRFVGTVTSDTITETSVTYYDNEAYWIAEFSNGSFTLLKGLDFQQKPSSEILALLTSNLQAPRYRDLQAEQAARERHQITRKFVLGQLVTGKEVSPEAWERLAIPEPRMPITSEEIRKAMDELQAEGKLTTLPKPTVADLRTDVGLRAEVLRELVTGVFILNYYFSEEWDNLIDEDLLEQSLCIKADLIVPAEDRPKMLHLLTWSPSALAWALHPDAIIRRHDSEPPEVRQLMQSEHARFYKSQIIQAAATDFHSNIGAAMYKKYRLRELHVHRRVSFKSDTRIEVELELDERFGLGELDTGGLVRVWLVGDAPEPWVRS